MIRRIQYLALILTLSVHGAFAAEPYALDTTGMVTDELGKPLAGATVELVRQKTTPFKRFLGIETIASAKSGADGAFHIAGTIPGDARTDFLVRAGAPARVVVQQPITFRKDGRLAFMDVSRRSRDNRLWFVLAPGRTVRGVVVNEKDQPVENCEVSTGQWRDPIRTGADGKFEIDGIPQPTEPGVSRGWFEVSHPGYVKRIVQPDNSQNVKAADGSLKVQLDPGVVIQGKLTEESTGAPLAGAAVTLYARLDRSDLNIPAYADEQGHYAARAPAGAEISFLPFINADPKTQRREFIPTDRERKETFTAGEEPKPVNLTFRKAYSIAGRVKLTQGGDPTLLLVSGTSPSTTVGHSDFCDEDGSFLLDALPPGSYHLKVTPQLLRRQGPVATADVEVVEGKGAGSVEIAIDQPIKPPPSLRGKVMRPDGMPAVLAAVRMQANGVPKLTGAGEARLTTVFTDLDGAFEMRGFASDLAGNSLWITDPSRDFLAIHPIEAGTDPAIPLAITLLPTSSVSGKVFGADDAPIAGIVVTVTQVSKSGTTTMHSPIASTKTDEQGKYTLKGFIIPEGVGDYRLEAHPPAGTTDQGFTSGEFTLALKPGESETGMDFRIAPKRGKMNVRPQRDERNDSTRD